ncbi:MAG: hypothetical protein IKT43_01065 [Clostridia bacterium]|nr:hypothetical protein [Clostridia bacterium]
MVKKKRCFLNAPFTFRKKRAVFGNLAANLLTLEAEDFPLRDRGPRERTFTRTMSDIFPHKIKIIFNIIIIGKKIQAIL